MSPVRRGGALAVALASVALAVSLGLAGWGLVCGAMVAEATPPEVPPAPARCVAGLPPGVAVVALLAGLAVVAAWRGPPWAVLAMGAVVGVVAALHVASLGFLLMPVAALLVLAGAVAVRGAPAGSG